MASYLNSCWIGLNWERLSSSAGLDLCCVSWEDLSSVSPCPKASASGQWLHEINVIPDLSLRNTERRLFRQFKLITQLKTCGKLSTSSLETTGSCKSYFLYFCRAEYSYNAAASFVTARNNQSKSASNVQKEAATSTRQFGRNVYVWHEGCSCRMWFH